MAWSGQPYHFTASAVVIHRQHVLLVYHPRIDAWVPPGGHIEDGELPHQAAVREVLEETGIAVEIVCQTPPVTADREAFFLCDPLCMHLVKAFEGQVPTYHLDIAYLCRPKLSTGGFGLKLPEATSGHGVREADWFAISKLSYLKLAKNVQEAVDLAQSRLDFNGNPGTKRGGAGLPDGT